MKPGRELDALVAEHVMGWKKVPVKFRHITWYWDKLEGCLLDDVQTPPKYSTNMEAAWEMFENGCKSAHTDISLHSNGRSEGTLNWVCKINNYEVKSISAPYAMCLTALKAVGIEIEKEYLDWTP